MTFVGIRDGVMALPVWRLILHTPLERNALKNDFKPQGVKQPP